jgi:hypothetical protein
MSRPMAYITAAWSNEGFTATQDAERYCRRVYEAGYLPVCPGLLFNGFLNREVMQERGDGIAMAQDLLRRSRIVVLCGEKTDEQVKDDINLAKRLHIAATTLDGIEKVDGRTKKEK